MKMLVICNDPPYGTERSWNGLRSHYHLDQMISLTRRPARRPA